MTKAATQSPPATTINIPLNMIEDAPGNARKHYEPKSLAELSGSIRERGLLQPVLVRPNPKLAGTYELVYGHRRYRAVQQNGDATIEAIVRDLTDEEARDAATAENLQRVDLSPIEEAELYAGEIKAGKAHKDIARIAGRDVSHIYRRVGLLRLIEPVQKALASGALPIGHAELLGGIEDPDFQKQAFERMWRRADNEYINGQWREGPRAVVPEATARRIIQTEFMNDVSKAPFDPKDPDLSPLGPCPSCPYLTGNAPANLFGDVKSKQICTNPGDFALKIRNWMAQQRELLGVDVATDSKDLKRIFPYGDHQPDTQHYVDLSSKCYQDPKTRTYDELLGEEQKRLMILAYHGGKLWRLFKRNLIDGALLSSGHKFLEKNLQRRAASPHEKAERDKQKVDKAINRAITAAYVEAVPKAKVKPAVLVDTLSKILVIDKGWQLDEILPRHGAPSQEGKVKTGNRGRDNREKMALELLAKMDDGQKVAFIIDAMIHNWTSRNSGPDQQAMAREVMILFGVDAKEIEKGVRAEFEEKRKVREAREAARTAKTKASTKAARGKKGKTAAKAEVTEGVCQHCGCTDDNACAPPCQWMNSEHTACSSKACIKAQKRLTASKGKVKPKAGRRAKKGA